METELSYTANEIVPRTMTGYGEAVGRLLAGARAAGVPDVVKSISLYASPVFHGRPQDGDVPMQKVDMTVKWTGEQHIVFASPTAAPVVPAKDGE